MTSNQNKISKLDKIFKNFSLSERSDTITVSDSDFRKKRTRRNRQPKRPVVVVAAPPKRPSSSTVSHTIGTPKQIIYKF